MIAIDYYDYHKETHSMSDDSDDVLYVQILDGWATRNVSQVEIRTKIEDYLITFSCLNGYSFIDGLTIEGDCTLVSRCTYKSKFDLSEVVAGIESYYGSDI